MVETKDFEEREFEGQEDETTEEPEKEDLLIEPKVENPLSQKVPDKEPIVSIIKKKIKPFDKTRLIDTSEERGIDEEAILKKNIEVDKQLGLDEQDFEEQQRPPIIIQEEPIQQEEDENELPYQEKDYMQEVLNSDPVLKAGITYSALKRKERSEGLREDEKEFIQQFEADQEEQNKQQALAADSAKIEQDIAEQKQAMMKEYFETKRTNPKLVATLDEQKLSLNGEQSLIQIIKFVGLLKKAKKKGGKVLVQVFKTRKVLFQYIQDDMLFVEFFSKDEKGNTVMDVCRFNEYKYSLEGTPIPVLFAVQGFAEGFDFYDSYRKSLDSETVNNLMLRSYHAGFLKGAEIREPEQGNNTLEKWMPLLMVVCVIGVVVMLYFGYMTYDKLKFLNSDSMTNLAALAKAYADSNGQMIIQAVSNGAGSAPVVIK
jgi:hypothetical protein